MRRSLMLFAPLFWFASLVAATPAFAEVARVLDAKDDGKWQRRYAGTVTTLKPGDPLEAETWLEPRQGKDSGYVVVIYCDLSTKVFTTAGQVGSCSRSNSLFRILTERFSGRLAKGGVRGIDLPERVVELAPGGRFDLAALDVSPGIATRVTLTPIDGSGNDQGQATLPFAPAAGPSPPVSVRPGLYRIALTGKSGRAIGEPGWVLLVDEPRVREFRRRFAEFESVAARAVSDLDDEAARGSTAMLLRAALGVLADDLGR